MSSLLSLLLALISIAIGLTSTVIYVLAVLRIDRYEREPAALLTLGFLWGAVPAIAISLILERRLAKLSWMPWTAGNQPLSTMLVAPIVEEIVKGIALLAIFRLAHHEFDDILDGVIYGSVVGFGFGMTENVVYFWAAQSSGQIGHWLQVVMGRTLAFGFNHAMFTSFTGIGLGLARYQQNGRQRRLTVAASLTMAIVVHALHNYLSGSGLCLISFLLDWSGVAFVLMTAFLAWRRERRWLTDYLAEEVEEGWLKQQEYEMLLSTPGGAWRLQYLLPGSQAKQARQQASLARTATELAFKKHQHSVMGEERGNSAAIAALRQKLVTARQEMSTTPDQQQQSGQAG